MVSRESKWKKQRDGDYMETSSAVEAAIQRCCPSWFDVARGAEPNYNPNELDTQVWLLSVLNLRQALIRWQSWNCNISSRAEICDRFRSFGEQVRVMALLLKARPPHGPARVDRRTSAVAAIRHLLRFDCSRWLDEQLVKTAGMVSRHSRMNLYDRTNELFDYLLFDLEREWGVRNTEAVVIHERQRQTNILHCTPGSFSTVITMISMLIYVADVGSDVSTGVELFREGNVAEGVLTWIWVVWMTIVIFSENCHKCTEERSAEALFISPLLPIIDLWREATLRWRVWRRRGSMSDRQRAMVELGNAERRANTMLYTKAKNEALPQLIAQIQLLLAKAHTSKQPVGLLGQLNVLTGIVSAGWSHTNNFRGVYYPTGFSLGTNLMLFTQDCLELAALIIAMSLFFYVSPVSLALPFWLSRTLLFMYLDRTFTTEEFQREISSATGCVTFLERFLFYGTHPFRVKHFKFGGVATFFTELVVLLGTYSKICCADREHTFTMIPIMITAAFFAVGVLFRQISVIGHVMDPW